MRNAGEHGLVHMPPVDQCIASLVLSPDEALKDNARCPRPQCRVMDILLLKAHDTAACMASLGLLQPHTLISHLHLLFGGGEALLGGSTAIYPPGQGC